MAKEKIQLPAMSDQMTEAEILSWKVDVGSKIKRALLYAKFPLTKLIWI